MFDDKIEVRIKELPDDIKREVLDYIEFLQKKYKKAGNGKRKFKFNWEGGLEKFRDKFTSVELQHKASDLR
jgi:hypothetical protein